MKKIMTKSLYVLAWFLLATAVFVSALTATLTPPAMVIFRSSLWVWFTGWHCGRSSLIRGS
jgi:hypothetical protein